MIMHVVPLALRQCHHFNSASAIVESQHVFDLDLAAAYRFGIVLIWNGLGLQLYMYEMHRLSYKYWLHRWRLIYLGVAGSDGRCCGIV